MAYFLPPEDSEAVVSHCGEAIGGQGTGGKFLVVIFWKLKKSPHLVAPNSFPVIK